MLNKNYIEGKSRYFKMTKRIFIFLIIIQFFFLEICAISIENKILFKVENEILTTVDFENQYKYLKFLNKDIAKLEKNKIFEIIKNSLIREKIKRIEILKNIRKIDLDKEYLDMLTGNLRKKLNIGSKDDFKIMLSEQNLKLSTLEEKFSIDAYWNEIILQKFESKIKINKIELKKQISQNKNEINSYNLSEIVFKIKKKGDLKNFFTNIKKDILEKGFENSVLIHSTADSSNYSGKLGWINEDSINNKLLKEIKNLDIGDFTKPIQVSSGFLIIKINDIKKIKNKVNAKEELERLISLTRNQQLNQYSNIYFDRIKKEIEIEKF